MMKNKLTLVILLFLPVFIFAKDIPFENLPDFKPDANAERSEIPDIYKWNLKDLCLSDEQWSNDFTQCKEELTALKKYHSDLKSPKGLKNYLMAYFDLDDKINRLTLYANLQREVESTNQEVISRHGLALNLTEKLMQEGAILRQAILSFSKREIQETIKKEPALKEYLPYINSLHRRADRVLSPEGEKLLSLAGDNLWAQIDLNELPSASEKAFGSIISELPLPMITDEEGKEVQLSFSNYGHYRRSPDRSVRQKTVAAMFGTLKSFENTFATTLGEQAKFSLFLSRARGYDTVLEAYLDKDDLDPAVYMNLIKTVKANVKPLHKYISLRKKMLNLDDIHLYDLYVPLVEASEMKMNYSNGSKLILDALKPLGEEYITQLEKGVHPVNGWIDLYPSSDKSSGAFSASTYGVHPYVMMNFQDNFNDVSTLAHEYGHAMHSYYSMNNQPYLSYRYVPFLAEIASTCNEALLSRYMIKNAKSDAEKAWLLSELLGTIRGTIYRQTQFAEFELKLHQLAETGEAINAAKLNSIYKDLIRTYYGPDFTIDENDHIEWAYIPHFYYKYYVFTYATGLSSGIAFAEKILKEGPDAANAYLSMLKGGNSKPPLVLLREAGVDLTKPEAIESALQLFDETVDQLEILLVK